MQTIIAEGFSFPSWEKAVATEEGQMNAALNMSKPGFMILQWNESLEE